VSGFLDGKAILITGAGSGIGEAAALVFASHGARLLLADVTRDAAERTAGAVRDGGGTADAVACDIGDEAQVAAMVAATVARYGRLDGAFNNAGIANEAPMAVDAMPADAFMRVVDVNLRGTFLCMKHEIAAMAAAGGGAIVNNASNAGKAATPMMAAYGASKAGLINLTKTAAVENAARGIRVNAVCPGLIMTAKIQAIVDAGFDVRAGLQIPMDRGGQPNEVAELAAWLLSPLASYLTGEAISIDGGARAMQ
jgi:NAD(P)-dependent dehydrogenase (short-subunit alcohol dehydrogenase family)